MKLPRWWPELPGGYVLGAIALAVAIFEFVFITHPEWWPLP